MQNFLALGLRPQTPMPPAAGGFAPRPPLASSGWGLCPQTPQTTPPPPLRISGYAPGSECEAPSHWVFFCNFLKKSYFDAIGSHFAHVQSNLKELDI